MPVVIAMLRAVNVGGRGKLPMENLRAICAAIGCSDVQTYIQSGNVVFKTAERSLPKLAAKLEDAIEKKFGFRPPVILRTPAQLRAVIENNPFAKRQEVAPNKLLVWFLHAPLSTDAVARVAALPPTPEEVKIVGSEVFVYFPNGQGQTKLNWATVERAMKVTGTGRNLNTVMKLLEMAEA